MKSRIRTIAFRRGIAVQCFILIVVLTLGACTGTANISNGNPYQNMSGGHGSMGW